MHNYLMNMANRAVPLKNSIGSKPMPVIGMGTAAFPWGSDPEATRSSVLRAIELGYRHFDTASLYQSEEPLGQAIAEALHSGLIKSRDELFVTSKLWFTDAHKDLVLPALQKSLQKLQLEYLDLYLIHVPIGVEKKQETKTDSVAQETVELCPIDISTVWMAMEECHALGLTKSIGVSNFSCKKLETLLSIAKVPPAVNQVEVNPVWQQKKLREFCVGKGIRVCAYSPLGGKGATWGQDWVMESHVLKEIAVERGKTIAQICLRWVIEQGDCVIVKSYNEKRMLENMDIFDWELSEEDRQKISQIPQRKIITGMRLISDDGPYKSLEEFWDGEI